MACAIAAPMSYANDFHPSDPRNTQSFVGGTLGDGTSLKGGYEIGDNAQVYGSWGIDDYDFDDANTLTLGGKYRLQGGTVLEGQYSMFGGDYRDYWGLNTADLDVLKLGAKHVIDTDFGFFWGGADYVRLDAKMYDAYYQDTFKGDTSFLSANAGITALIGDDGVYVSGEMQYAWELGSDSANISSMAAKVGWTDGKIDAGAKLQRMKISESGYSEKDTGAALFVQYLF